MLLAWKEAGEYAISVDGRVCGRFSEWLLAVWKKHISKYFFIYITYILMKKGYLNRVYTYAKGSMVNLDQQTQATELLSYF